MFLRYFVPNLGYVLAAFAAVVCLIPALGRVAPRLGLLDEPGGRKRHARVTPLVGGIGILAGALGVLLWAPLDEGYLPLFVCCLIIAGVGVLDDRSSLDWRVRLLAQLLAGALMIGWGGVYLQSLGDLCGGGEILLRGPWAVAVTLLAVVGIVNAVNLADGVDGLAGGLSLVALLPLALLAADAGRATDSLVLGVLAAAVAGFLVYNFRFRRAVRARVFLGDAGSTLLGFVLCWFTISLSQGDAAAMSPVVAPWLLALPIFDTLFVMGRRLGSGGSPFRPDRRHLHHALLGLGLSVRRTAALVVAVAAVLAMTAVSLYVMGASDSALFVGYLILFGLYVVFKTRLWRLRVSASSV